MSFCSKAKKYSLQAHPNLNEKEFNSHSGLAYGKVFGVIEKAKSTV